MNAHYLIQITEPKNNHLKVTLKLDRPEGSSKLRVFLPSWSPGSYLMREYSRHVTWFKASQENGEELFFSQKEKGIWEIDWEKSELKTKQNKFEISYEVYAKELTVRTSHVDESHAFLHGPTYLMGVVGESLPNPTIEFRFPPGWSKLSTGLKDITQKREIFLYTAKNYDELIDSPVEIGCHETDGFLSLGKPHNLAFYGDVYPHQENLKADIKKVVETVAAHFGDDVPYDDYTFITHFVPKLYGGLEHLNSTALHFDGRKLGNRKDYLNYLSLVAHEYFHLWNVKRIRPSELGPFDYTNENYTRMLWLAEGLTSFLDDLFIYRAGFSSLEEYLDIVRGNLAAYLTTPGRLFHSLEDSSFNAWIKLYRPDENSKNSSVSYYLKGGLVFMVLHSLLLKEGKSVDDLLELLWQDYKSRKDSGITKEGVYALVEKLGGQDTLNKFSTMIETTEDIDFESALNSMGLSLRWSESTQPYLGVEWEWIGDRAIVKSVILDSPAYKSGLNAGDEVLFWNDLRFLREDAQNLNTMVRINVVYNLTVARLGKLKIVPVMLDKAPRELREICITDRPLAEKSFIFSKKL